MLHAFCGAMGPDSKPNCPILLQLAQRRGTRWNAWNASYRCPADATLTWPGSTWNRLCFTGKQWKFHQWDLIEKRSVLSRKNGDVQATRFWFVSFKMFQWIVFEVKLTEEHGLSWSKSRNMGGSSFNLPLNPFWDVGELGCVDT